VRPVKDSWVGVLLKSGDRSVATTPASAGHRAIRPSGALVAPLQQRGLIERRQPRARRSCTASPTKGAATRTELHTSRDVHASLAEQQAALRRVATLVARGVSPSEVFLAVADEMAGCLHAQNASVNRFEGDTVVVLALSHLDPGMKSKPVVGERHTLEGDNIATSGLSYRPGRATGRLGVRKRSWLHRRTSA
jgi:uncharacterized protein YoaH (UPF0181 family)